jgi:pSer/pThr/pTyr-binding forkhead associated (FHA) protein
MRTELVLLDGSSRKIPLEEGAELTIGTSAQCSLRLTAVDVSRSHAMLTCQRGKISLLDLGSTNGTFVNGRRVKETELEPGDVVRFSSVIAQVMPLGSGSGSDGLGNPPSPETTLRLKPSDHDSGSGEVPIILQDSLIWLLQRWDISGGDALVALVEWLVARRGMRGAAVAEEIDGETSVRAAHGGLLDVLDDPRLGAVVRAGAMQEGALETVQTRLGSHDVVAVHSPQLPCLLLLPGAMPAASDIELFVALLRVAQRLETAAHAPRRSTKAPRSR